MQASSVKGAHASPVCKHETHASKKSNVIALFEKISAVALGIFSLYTSYQLFLPFFAFGTAIGYDQNQNDCNRKVSHSSSGCSHGFLEQITGVKLPAPLSIAANVAMTVCHIDHHAAVFVPIVAVTIGAWVGKMASEALSHKLSRHERNFSTR